MPEIPTPTAEWRWPTPGGSSVEVAAGGSVLVRVVVELTGVHAAGRARLHQLLRELAEARQPSLAADAQAVEDLAAAVRELRQRQDEAAAAVQQAAAERRRLLRDRGDDLADRLTAATATVQARQGEVDAVREAAAAAAAELEQAEGRLDAAEARLEEDCRAAALTQLHQEHEQASARLLALLGPALAELLVFQHARALAGASAGQARTVISSVRSPARRLERELASAVEPEPAAPPQKMIRLGPQPQRHGIPREHIGPVPLPPAAD